MIWWNGSFLHRSTVLPCDGVAHRRHSWSSAGGFLCSISVTCQSKIHDGKFSCNCAGWPKGKCWDQKNVNSVEVGTFATEDWTGIPLRSARLWKATANYIKKECRQMTVLFNCLFDMMAKWLSLLPHSKKALSSIPGPRPFSVDFLQVFGLPPTVQKHSYETNWRL